MLDVATLATLNRNRAHAPLDEWPYPVPGDVVCRVTHRGTPHPWQRPATVGRTVTDFDLQELEAGLNEAKYPLSEIFSRWRVRFGRKFRTFTPAKTVKAIQALKGDLLVALRGARPDPDGAFGLRVRFCLEGRARPDCDNLLKTTFESLSETVMEDDRQVCEGGWWRVQRDPDPRTEMLVYRVIGE